MRRLLRVPADKPKASQREANKAFFAGEFKTFSAEAADLLLETGIIKQKPDMEALADTSFIQ